MPVDPRDGDVLGTTTQCNPGVSVSEAVLMAKPLPGAGPKHSTGVGGRLLVQPVLGDGDGISHHGGR